MSEQGGPTRGPLGSEPRPRPLAADVFDTMPVGVALLRVDGVLVHVNPVLADLLGAVPDALGGQALAELVDPAERAHVPDLVERLADGRRNAFSCLLRARPADHLGPAERTWAVRAHVAAAYGPSGRVEGLVLQVFDFAPVEVAAPLPAGLVEVLEEGSDFLLTATPDGRIAYANRAARELFGARLGGSRALLDDVLEPESLARYRDQVEPQVMATGSWQGELTFRTRVGHPMPVSARIVAHRQAADAPAGDAARAVSVFARDITELKSAEKKLRQLATHDYLTGLPNRLLLYDRLEHALHRHSRHGTPVALMFCDLDGFKPVNDVYGHQVGDAVLTEVADRIHSVVRDTDTAARLGGDEFGVLLEDFGDRSTLEVVAQRLVAAIGQPIRTNGSTVQIGVSIGIAVAGPGRTEVDALVNGADSLMYQAKADGKGRYRFSDGEPGPDPAPGGPDAG